MKIQTNQYRITKGQTLIEVPHKDSILTFVYEKYGLDTYANVAESIDKEGLARPTMAETASLVHPAFTSEKEEPEFKDIKQTMKSNWLWAFTGNLYIPNKGVYIQDNPEIRNKMPYMEESELVRKLESKDESVRFVPFGYQTESMYPRELAKNEYIKALAGEEEAEKLAEVADKHKNKPYIWSFKSVEQPLTRVSALNSSWGLDLRLVVDGYSRGYIRGGFAFGVQKAGEASRKK